MSRRKKRFWADEEKQEICAQATTPGMSVAQVARRYAVNANLIFKWLKDPRFAPVADASAQEATFLPIEIEADAVHEPAPIDMPMPPRVEVAHLKAVRADGVLENTSETTEQVLQKTQQMDPREVISEPHILITKQLNPVTCSQSETEQASGVVPNVAPENLVDKELEEWVAETRKKRGAALDLPTVMQACPEFASWARNIGGCLKDWGDLHRVVGQLRPMIEVSEHAWNIAQDRLGPQIATAALVLTFEKHCAGEVASPGGYLRGIVQKAGAGELHLERSFYGRLSGQAA